MVSQTYNMIDKNWSHIKDYHFFILYSYDKIWTYGLNVTLYYHAIRHKFDEPPKAQERVVKRELVKEKIVNNLYESDCLYYISLHHFRMSLWSDPDFFKKKTIITTTTTTTRVVVRPYNFTKLSFSKKKRKKKKKKSQNWILDLVHNLHVNIVLGPQNQNHALYYWN